MPLYTVTTPDGLLSAEQREFIAAELVRIHTTTNQVPANLVHSIFLTYPRGHAYVAENPSPIASIIGTIRTGRAPELKTRLVQAPWKMLQDNTGISDSNLSVVLQEGCTEPGDGEWRRHAGSRTRTGAVTIHRALQAGKIPRLAA